MRHRILVVEDDPEIRDGLEELLSSAGYRVTADPTGEDGLHSLSAGPFDLVVTDYALPGCTGTAMLREAARIGNAGRIPAILVTGHSEPEQVEGVPLLRKPVDPRALLALVSSFLPRRRATGP